MASISITFTDNNNGVTTNSFNFTDSEMGRIIDSLRVIYSDRFKPYPKDPQDKDILPTNKQILEELSSSLTGYVLQSCREAEIQVKVDQFKQEVQAISPR